MKRGGGDCKSKVAKAKSRGSKRREGTWQPKSRSVWRKRLSDWRDSHSRRSRRSWRRRGGRRRRSSCWRKRRGG